MTQVRLERKVFDTPVLDTGMGLFQHNIAAESHYAQVESLSLVHIGLWG